jgi:hypothetical protein
MNWNIDDPSKPDHDICKQGKVVNLQYQVSLIVPVTSLSFGFAYPEVITVYELLPKEAIMRIALHQGPVHENILG